MRSKHSLNFAQKQKSSSVVAAKWVKGRRHSMTKFEFGPITIKTHSGGFERTEDIRSPQEEIIMTVTKHFGELIVFLFPLKYKFRRNFCFLFTKEL